MARPIRSLTLPSGLKYSHLTNIRAQARRHNAFETDQRRVANGTEHVRKSDSSSIDHQLECRLPPVVLVSRWSRKVSSMPLTVTVGRAETH